MDRYAVIGHPVAHSKSPEIHAAFAAATGQAMRYERLLAPLDDFFGTLEQFRREGGVGANVTLPFKLEAYAATREHSARAVQAGAVNTLAWRGDHWFGDNTDGIGLVRDLRQNLGCRLTDQRVLVLGAGGAARGILGPLLAAHPAMLVLSNRTVKKADELAALFAEDGPIVSETARNLAGQSFDLVINATSSSVSESAHPLPWPEGLFVPGALAYDLMYAQEPTSFLRWAEAQGAARLADGLGMLVEQAAESFFLWRSLRPATRPVLEALRG
ncbi:shikimate dehydrogenase [Burkholderiales bacterium]|nr:MAG: shikimate dehydrogenase [Burkholderiales bacterium]CAG0966035.1 shikimate dehydrogenase [Burkholderiales bacterium]